MKLAGNPENNPGTMWPFEKVETLEEPPAPTDHQAACLERVRAAKRELDAFDAEMLKFKRENKITTDRFGRLLGCQCATLNGRSAIEVRWRALLNLRDVLVSEWHTSLHLWSTAKETRERERKEANA